MPYGDLLKLDARVVTTEPNPCVLAYGPGPEGKRCKHCENLYAKRYAGTYYKCSFRGDTNGPGTDHRVNWRACGKFQEREKP